MLRYGSLININPYEDKQRGRRIKKLLSEHVDKIKLLTKNADLILCNI